MRTTDSTARPSPPPASPPARGMLWTLAAAPFVVVLDSTSVNVALPTISAALALSPSTTSWVLNAYLVACGGLLLLGGRLADVLPPRAVLLAGLGLFSAGGVVSAVAPSGSVLVAARAVQGVGAALMMPTALTLMAIHFPPGPARVRAMGMWGVASGAGGALGVMTSGILVSGPGWRWTFLVGVVVAAVAAACALRVVSATAGRGGTVDLLGAASVTMGLGALTYALVTGAEQGWTQPTVLASGIAAVVGLAVFVRSCRRSAAPLIRPALARIRTVVTANMVILAVGAVAVSTFFLLPLYQQQVLAWSPISVGLSQLPLSAAIVVASVLAPRLARRVGTTPVLITGLVLVVIGLAWLAPTPASLSVLAYLVPSILIGAGVGTGFVLATDLGVAAVDPAESGAASGLLSASREVGGAIGVALVTAAATTIASAGQNLGGTVGGLTSGYGAALLTAAALAAAAILVLLARRTRRTRPAPDSPTDTPYEAQLVTT